MNETEKQILVEAKTAGLSLDTALEALKRYRLGVKNEVPAAAYKDTTVKDITTGFAKGIGDTARGLQMTGNVVAGALMPGVSIDELNRDTEQANFELTGLTDEDLKAKNAAEMVGKGAQFAASVFLPGGAPAKAAAGAASKATSLAGKGIKAAGQSIPSIADNLVYEAATPKITQKIATQAAKSGKVSSNSALKAGELILSPRQTEVSNAVKPILTGTKDPIEAISKLSQKISELDARATQLATDVNPIFNMNQLKAFVSKVKDENSLVFASDPQAEKVYDAVIDALITEVKQGNTKALFEARKSFDKLPAVQKLLSSSPLGENLRRQAVLDVRRAANDYLQELLPEGDEFRAILKEESLLFDAINNLATKYGKDALTKSKLRQFIEKVPLVRDTLQGVLPAGAISAGMNAID